MYNYANAIEFIDLHCRLKALKALISNQRKVKRNQLASWMHWGHWCQKIFVESKKYGIIHVLTPTIGELLKYSCKNEAQLLKIAA